MSFRAYVLGQGPRSQNPQVGWQVIVARPTTLYVVGFTLNRSQFQPIKWGFGRFRIGRRLSHRSTQATAGDTLALVHSIFSTNGSLTALDSRLLWGVQPCMY